jgi:hypothetical protein
MINCIAEIIRSAGAAASAGVSVIPIDHATKKPIGEWATAQKMIYPMHGQEDHWLAKGVQAYAAVGGAVSGNLLVIDFDVEGYFEQWLAAVSDFLPKLVLQETGGGGWQALFRSAVPVGGNEKLAWHPKPDSEQGREVAIETRGEGGYAIMAPSLHPSGNRYRWEQGDLTTLHTFGGASVEAMLMAARRLCSAPLTRQQQEQRTKATVPARKLASAGESVVDAFNRTTTIRDMLLSCGYTPSTQGRMLRPGANPDSVPGVILNDDGTSYHFSSNDILNDGHRHDAFDVYRVLKHGGDMKTAVRAAARELGIEFKPAVDGRAAEIVVSSPAKELDELLEDTISGKRRNIRFTMPIISRLTKALLPATATVLCGRAGSKKTWWLLSECIGWQRSGIPFSAYMLEEKRSWHLYRTLAILDGNSHLADDDWIRANPTETRAAKDKHRPFIEAFGKRIFTPDKDVTHDDLLAWARREAEQGSRIIAIDPVTLADGSTQKIWIDDKAFVSGLKRVQDKHGVSTLLVTHPKPGKHESPLDGIAGGQAYNRFTQTVMVLASHKSKPKAVYLPNIGGINEPRWMYQSVVLAKTRNGKGEGAEVAVEMDDATLKWREIGVSAGEVPKKELRNMPPQK